MDTFPGRNRIEGAEITDTDPEVHPGDDFPQTEEDVPTEQEPIIPEAVTSSVQATVDADDEALRQDPERINANLETVVEKLKRGETTFSEDQAAAIAAALGVSNADTPFGVSHTEENSPTKGLALPEDMERAEARKAAIEGGGREEVVAAEDAEEEGSLEEWSRDELYERAQELDIPGRSDMNKDELIDAIREHEDA